MAPVRIAIVHHHLRPGGVTRVISRAVRALSDPFALAVLSGESPAAGAAPDCKVGLVEGLGYVGNNARLTARDIARHLRESADAALGAPPDIWHVHNHSLGKNPAVSEAVALMATEGERLLLHIHDFAEDGRPDNYRALLTHADNDSARLSAMLYPRAGHVHYATINSRDHAALVRAGIPPEQVHLIHNPVDIEGATPWAEDGYEGGPRRFLYPSRAIRRKNVGELLLWASLAQDGDRFAVTMAPQNPAQRPAYDAWVAFARDNNLPVEFEVGGGSCSLNDLLRASTAAVTTSVAEGFGLSFLEPALAGRPVVGRDLPEVTAGLTRLGIDLSGLYARLDVPVDWIGADRLRDMIASALARSRASFGRRPSSSDAGAALAEARQGDHVDFGRLDEALQRTVLERVIRDPGARADIRPPELGPSPGWSEALSHNRAVIAREFSPTAYALNLRRAYAAVLGSDITRPTALEPDAMLDQFLDPRRFIPLMT